MANLQEQLPIGGELEHLTVPHVLPIGPDNLGIRFKPSRPAPSNPYVSLGIHGEAELLSRPVLHIVTAPPGLENVASRVEFEYRRRRDAAFRERWFLRQACFVAQNPTRRVQHPNVIAPIHRYRGDAP